MISKKKYKLIFLMLLFTRQSHAFLGDGGAGWAQLPYLIKILEENYNRYKQLQVMIQTAKNQEEFLKSLTTGLDNSIGLLESLPLKNEKILSELKDFKKGYGTVLDLYGSIPKSKEEALQVLHDKSVAESFKMVAMTDDHSRLQEENADLIKINAREASLKGAARMTAESNALILDSLNQLIKLQAQSLKLQSEQLAMQNKNSKTQVDSFQKINQGLGDGFKKFQQNPGLTRF
ncbi:MAG: hypothetical protein H6623_01705 [Bdellovibrionaceae bacterium]|nr:hypothetical protein [Pseudobdellovibrionaceae bacterium]